MTKEGKEEVEFEENKRPIDCDKPRFYIMDLENYTDDFLREIIRWMDKKIKSLGGEIK